MLEIEDKIATLAAHQVAERRGLVRERGDGRRHVGCQLGSGNHAVAVQIAASIERL